MLVVNWYFCTTTKFIGGVAEWLNAPVLKTGDLERGPRVRISPPPHKNKELDTLYPALYFHRRSGDEKGGGGIQASDSETCRRAGVAST